MNEFANSNVLENLTKHQGDRKTSDDFETDDDVSVCDGAIQKHDQINNNLDQSYGSDKVDENHCPIDLSLPGPSTIDCAKMWEINIGNNIPKIFERSILDHKNITEISAKMEKSSELVERIIVCTKNSESSSPSVKNASSNPEVVEKNDDLSMNDSDSVISFDSCVDESQSNHNSLESSPNVVESQSSIIFIDDQDSSPSRCINQSSSAQKKLKLETIAKKLLLSELKNQTSHLSSSQEKIDNESSSSDEDATTDFVVYITSDSDEEASILQKVKQSLVKENRIHPTKSINSQDDNNGKNVHFCNICDKQFAFKSNLTKHLKLHSAPMKINKRETPLSCNLCNKVFRKKDRLIRHEKIHTKMKKIRLPCTLCDKSFPNQTDLDIHLRVHAGEKPFPCEECGRRFACKPNLKSHRKIHAGIKPHNCEKCGKCFSRKSDLKNHDRIHTGEKPFLCTTCGKSFAQRGHMDNHLKTHTGVRPHVCSICNKKFTRRTDMNRHIRIHTGVKPYMCEICGRSFAQSGHFLIHTRVHSGETPYYCDICYQGFAQLYSLKSHLKTCNGIEVPHSFVSNENLMAHPGSVQDIVTNSIT